MKVIIAGGRSYQPTSEDRASLDFFHEQSPITEVLCGMANGADAEGARWARRRGIPVHEYPPNWASFGKRAGPMRNQTMVDDADALIAFPGGAGTADVIRRAKSKGIDVCLIGHHG